MDADAFYAVASAFMLVTFVAFVNERFVELLVKRLLAYWLAPQTMDIIIAYVAILTGALLSIVLGLDVFAPLAAAIGLHPMPGSTPILTALLVGGGSNLIHDVWGAVQQMKAGG